MTNYCQVKHIIEYTTQNDKAQEPITATRVATEVPVATPAIGNGGTNAEDASKHSAPIGEPDKSSSKATDRPLITYAYSESTSARENLKFFLSQGLHDAADFIFILNGETNVADLIPKERNIQIIRRPNECFDLGAHGEVLRKDDLWKNYKRFITLNASIRGPFIPYWAKRCWSDVFLSRVTEEVKVSRDLDALMVRMKLMRLHTARRNDCQLPSPISHPIHDMGDRLQRHRVTPVPTARFLDT